MRSCCVCVCMCVILIVDRQRLRKHVHAATNTEAAIEELLDCRSLCSPCHIKANYVASFPASYLLVERK
jgi:hypothetical protein